MLEIFCVVLVVAALCMHVLSSDRLWSCCEECVQFQTRPPRRVREKQIVCNWQFLRSLFAYFFNSARLCSVTGEKQRATSVPRASVCMFSQRGLFLAHVQKLKSEIHRGLCRGRREQQSIFRLRLTLCNPLFAAAAEAVMLHPLASRSIYAELQQRGILTANYWMWIGSEECLCADNILMRWLSLKVRIRVLLQGLTVFSISVSAVKRQQLFWGLGEGILPLLDSAVKRGNRACECKEENDVQFNPSVGVEPRMLQFANNNTLQVLL